MKEHPHIERKASWRDEYDFGMSGLMLTFRANPALLPAELNRTPPDLRGVLGSEIGSEAVRGLSGSCRISAALRKLRTEADTRFVARGR